MHRLWIPLLLAFASGVAALIYEVVWFPLLQLSIGSTTASTGWLLASFMGGMCLGSLLAPRIAPAWNPWRFYAAVEGGIAILGIAVLWMVPQAGALYTAWAGDGITGLLLRGAVAAACLTPPAVLTGATLPALARCLGSSAASAGMIYAANIFGAVCGGLWAGFDLLPSYDMLTATCVAAGINLAVAALALAPFHDRSPHEDGPHSAAPRPDPLVLVAIGVSGFCALGSEVIWTRTLGLLFGASVYALSLILAGFLAGLGIGSALGTLAGRILAQPRLALGACQLLACAAMAWAAYTLSASLPYWPVNPAIASGVRFSLELDLARALWVLLPSTVLWGASFPLALQAASGEPGGGKLMARVYSANTFGAVAGALAVSLWLVGWLGTQGAQRVLIAASAGAALLLLVGTRRIWIPAGLGVAALSIAIVPPFSELLTAHGRFAATWVGKGEVIYAAEGRHASIAVSRFSDDTLTFHVAGKIQASTAARDLRLQRMLGHLTTLTVPQPRSVLVIGCGAGVTAGAVSIDPRVERVTIAEIEPLVPQAAARYFREANFDVRNNPKTRLRIDDGRHFLLTSHEKFDAITVDPLDPWVSGAANLYTKEFYEAAKRHLHPGGAVTMYVQLFETTPEAVKSTLATFFDVFPNGTVWGNPYDGRGHDMVLLGTVEPLHVDLDEMELRVDYRGESMLSQSLTEVGMESPVDLFATYAGRKSDLEPWWAGAPLNRDSNLRMQYLAGLGLHLDESAAIYSAILSYLRFPENLFTSAEGRLDSLRRKVPAR